jgi:DNA-binding GntR family transcriptional regulator
MTVPGTQTPPPTGPQTSPQHVLDGLRRAIIARELRPGERVGQEDVAQRLGVSVAPVREALRILEQEGQVTYLPRRGYFVTELRYADLAEIYDLRGLLERRAATAALPHLEAADLARIRSAARECADAVQDGDVLTELAANRRFHFAIMEPAGQPHLLRLIRLLWDSTEAYRAIYYNSAGERRQSLDAHDRIIAALNAGDAADLIDELDAHRERALVVLREVLGPE